MALDRAYYRSPIGTIELIGNERGLLEVRFAERKASGRRLQPPPVIAEAVEQLEEYFAGYRRNFTLKLQLKGTDFEQKAWREVRRVPYGRTASYGEVARSLGQPGAARAIGGANHRNPIVIIVPCHRIIGADGQLVGYGGGLWRKEWLLAHEMEHSHAQKRR